MGAKRAITLGLLGLVVAAISGYVIFFFSIRPVTVAKEGKDIALGVNHAAFVRLRQGMSLKEIEDTIGLKPGIYGGPLRRGWHDEDIDLAPGFDDLIAIRDVTRFRRAGWLGEKVSITVVVDAAERRLVNARCTIFHDPD